MNQLNLKAMTTNQMIETLKDLNTTKSASINEMIDDINLKLKFADAVLEETGADIENNEIEHQLGTVWVGNIAISGVETEDV